MQKSPSISLEHDSLLATLSCQSSSISLNKTNQLMKWHRQVKRIIRFFRFIRIPLLRLRFVDMVHRMSLDYRQSEQLKGFVTKNVQDDLHFIDDIRRYREVFNTFTSFGFTWDDREFRLARLKANYIYDRYLSSPEAIAKTNIPSDTVPAIFNRLTSSKISSSLTYLNLFNDAEKFIMEKILVIYMNKGIHCFTQLPDKPSTRLKNRSTSKLKHLNHTNSVKDVLVSRPEAKHINITEVKPHNDGSTTANWTYSTTLGMVYNRTHDQFIAQIQKNISEQEKHLSSMKQPNHNVLNERKLLHSTTSKSVSPALSSDISKFASFLPRRQQPTIHDYQQPIVKDEGLLPNKKSTCEKRQTLPKIFICKVHSSTWPESHRLNINIETPYRMVHRRKENDCLREYSH